MDPYATIKEFIRSTDKARRRELQAAYAEWRKRGGFPVFVRGANDGTRGAQYLVMGTYVRGALHYLLLGNEQNQVLASEYVVVS